MISIATRSPSPKTQQWYRPTVSLEHGVYVMLIVSFLNSDRTLDIKHFIFLQCNFYR